MNPLITLAMPIYNVEKYVEKSLTSALNQTYDNLEILVIDDKGTDRSMDEVRRIISSHPRGNCVIIIEHEKNQGLANARNTAIANANGEYLYFMDSDDEITPDCIETLYAAMKETPVDFIIGSLDEVDDNGNLIQHRKYNEFYCSSNDEILKINYDTAIQKKVNSLIILGTSWNRLFNVKFLKLNNMQFVPFAKNEDNLFSFLLNLKADSCRVISNITYRYNIARPGSIMFEQRKTYTRSHFLQDLDNLEYYTSYIEYIKETKGDVAKYILNAIAAFGATTKRKMINLNQTATEKQEAIQKIRCLTASIKLSDLPNKLGSLFVWLNLKSPSFLDPLFQWALSVKSKIKPSAK